jgi:hypothetical protein
MASLVLTNSYKSVVTTDLTAPFSNKRLETFDDVMRLAYKVLPPLNSFMAAMMRSIEEFNANETIERQVKRETTRLILRQSHLTEALQTEVSSPNTLPRIRIMSQRMLNLIGAPENFPEVSFQMEIRKCNKSIYVDNDYQLDQFRTDALILGSGNLRSMLYKGKESFQKKLFSWRVIRMEWDRTGLISKRWSAISHSGIFSQLDYVYRSGKMKSQIRKVEKLFVGKVEESVRPLALKSTVLSIFILYLASVCFCLSSLLAENIFNLFYDYECKFKAWILKV